MGHVKRGLTVTAVAVLGNAVFMAAPADAAGTVCDGQQVRTCINVRVEKVDKYRIDAGAAARITDLSDGSDFQVKTTHVRMQYWQDGRWKNAPATKDFDGWHDREDLALSAYKINCYTNSPGSVRVRAQARFDWKRLGADHEWMTSKPVTIC